MQQFKFSPGRQNRLTLPNQQSIYFIILLIILSNYAATAQPITAIQSSRMLDVENKSVLNDKVILVQEELIVEVGGRELLSKADTIIDLTEYTLLPGLIDAHVHPLIFGDNYQLTHMSYSSAGKALKGLHVVQQWLQEGWTTLRIAGDADVHYAHFDIRDAINDGLFQGPRIYGAGHYLSVTGGGGDINFLAPEQDVTADGLIVDGPDEIRKAVRQELKYGSDWIKLLVTGAFMSAGDNPQNVHFSEEELRVAIEEANNRNVPVMAHAHATEGIKMAIRAGARSIEHGSFLDDEAIDLLVEHDVYLVPTMAVGAFIVQQNSPSQAKSIALHHRFDQAIKAMLRKAVKRGVKMGVGSDNVGFPPGFAYLEFEELVKLGMTPIESIAAGTIINAQLLMKENEIGSISKGKFADLVAVRGKPDEDISILRNISFVMKGGDIIKYEQ